MYAEDPLEDPHLMVLRALRRGATLDEATALLEPADKADGDPRETEWLPEEVRRAECPDLRTAHGEAIEACSQCGGFDLAFELGFVHCRSCDHCETAPVFDWEGDYRTYQDSKGDTSRCLAPRNKLQTPQLMITGNGRSALERMHRSYCSTYHDKTLDAMCRHLESVAKAANIQQRTIDLACGYVHQVFKKDSDGTFFRGGNREGLLGACLYYAMKYTQTFHNLDEVTKILKMDLQPAGGAGDDKNKGKNKYVRKGKNEFAEILEHVASVSEFFEHKPEMFVNRWVSQLVFQCPKMHKLRPDLFDERFAKNLADRLTQCLAKLEERKFHNKPETLTAGCLWWLLSNNPKLIEITGLTRKDLAPICHVSESTIDQMAKDINRVFVVQT